MKILGVLGLFGSLSAYAVTTPATDIYSDSLTIERASAEVPGSLEASRSGAGTGDTSGEAVDLDTAATAEFNDEQPMESVSEVVKASKPKAKKAARK